MRTLQVPSYLTFLIVLCGGQLTRAAGDPAIADLSKVGPAYQFIGEYMGQFRGKDVGLQVSTRDGDQPFYAKLFTGGLPGIGWNHGDPQRFSGTAPLDSSLEGKRPEETNRLTLSCDASSGAQLVIGENMARLVDSLGNGCLLRKVSRRGVTMGLRPPAGATILFDGSSLTAFRDAKNSDDGFLRGGAETLQTIGACRIHLEFRTPYMPQSVDQKRGNSGVYIQRRYEVQILESFGQDAVFNGCGALYRQREPDVNMSLPPLVWQTYDIFFTPARFDAAGEKTRAAQLTVIHNGVPVHYRTAIAAKTGAGRQEGPDQLPLLLQDHGDPVVFRNVWMVSR